MPSFINIAAYKFVQLDRLAERKSSLLLLSKSLHLKGTILLSSEGINLFLAGSRSEIDQFVNHLRQQTEFADLSIKESISDHQPFNRMLVRLKKEIISMGVEKIRPQQKTSAKISARQLKQWLDEGRDIALLDVRNDYEVELGTFEKAISVGIDHFRSFPAASDKIPAGVRNKPVVMFCTGGIRCEKAGPLLEEKGFRNVFQLDGGILKYFEECGGDHYHGDCFVFDKRVAVNPDLQETDAQQCYGCQAILSMEDQQSPQYDPPRSCPYCCPATAQPLAQRLLQRAATLAAKTDPLPGSIPYDNVRPMNVSSKFDNRPLIEFLLSMHIELDRTFWIAACQENRVMYKDKPLAWDTVVRAGWRINHITPQTVEPPVSNAVRFLYEDDALIAIDKPGPLPMHPCGRFNRNTLQHFLRLSYPNEQVRILHRLDADTTGVLLLARNRETAAAIQRQFASGEITKTYLAAIVGCPDSDAFECFASISDKPVCAGGVRRIDSHGRDALTRFQVLKRHDDGTAIVQCFPVTGRTNQIRIHLAHLGWPIVGDVAYGSPAASVLSASKSNLGLTNPSTVTPMRLHASKLEFNYPAGKRMIISAPDPQWI